MDTQKFQSSPPRDAPSLLPAFEPLSSSPVGTSRLSKRKYDEHVQEDSRYYPTPVPTSSTGILPSSPNARQVRPKLQRTVSALSERAPLSAVPSLEIPANGEPIHMGRSSNSSDYQLSSNRLISRVHVRAKYDAPSELCPEGEVIVECMGWNGCKIHYAGQVLELAKGERFASHKPLAQIMVDVQETRVILVWPMRSTSTVESRSITPCPAPSSPVKQGTTVQDLLASSPPIMPAKLRSPQSLSPLLQPDATFASTFVASQLSATAEQVEVYEDHFEEAPREATPTPANATPRIDDVPASLSAADSTQSSSLSEPDELSEHDEENDPIVHSFGPFGQNLLNKFSSFKSVASPEHHRTKMSTEALGIDMPSDDDVVAAGAPRAFRESPVKNHVINQLAYSRVHSVPLSTIFSNVPSDMKLPSDVADGKASESAAVPMNRNELKHMINAIPCVGKIRREGKDAAGKPLEDEFYYLPEADKDELRRTAVLSGRPPLRNVRKSHKQYFWKKPR